MAEQDQTLVESEAQGAKRPFQFGLRTVLELPLLVALFFALAAIVGTPLAVVLYVVLLVLTGLCFRRTRTVSCLALALLLLGMLTLPFMGDGRPAARRIQCGNNLKAIALALHNYHQAWGCFPPAVMRDARGRPMHSWRTLILPYLGEQALYAKYRFDEPWNGPNNSQLASTRVWAFACAEQHNRVAAQTSYLAVTGPSSAWPDDKPASTADFTDGTCSTILVVEVRDSGVLWMEPSDLDIHTMPKTINHHPRYGISSKHWGGATTLFADGSVKFLGDKLPAKFLSALLTRNGGEQLDPEW